MKQNEFDDQDAQAAWELLGRHQGVEPSFGFAQRTLRRLHEMPAPRFWQLPVFRWAAVLSSVAIIAGGSLLGRHRAEARRAAEVYVAAHQDKLEDYDVIAALDLLEAKNRL